MNKELANVTKLSGIVFISKIGALILGLLLNFLAARFLGAEVYGKFMYVFTFIALFPILSLMGLQHGMVYFIPKFNRIEEENERNKLITYSIFLVMLLSIAMAMLLYTTSGYIAREFLNNPDLEKLLKFLSPLIVFLAINQLAQGIFQGVKKIKYFVFNQDFIVPVFKIIIFVITILVGYKIFSLVLSFYFGIIIGTIYLLLMIYRLGFFSKIRLKDIIQYKEIYRYSLPLLFINFMSIIWQKADILMIGYFLNERQVGIYDIALKIGTISSFILIAVNTVFAPTISTLYHKGDLNKLAYMYKSITKWIVGVNLIAFSLILLFSKEIMRTFGSEYMIGSTALILIGIGQVVNAGVGSAGYIISMTGNPSYEAYINVLVVIINVLLNYTLIPIYGIEGAAFASLISLAIANLVRLVIVYKKHKFHPYNFAYIKIVLATSISFIFVYFAQYFSDFLWYVKLFLFSIVFAVIFLIVYSVMGLEQNEKNFIAKLIKINKK
ncbi:flippase [Oceanobacillus salinisoli]|uniref:flippase n=1 Tax=Oceanobacillus salinisoli TaxID=2678611 RepID=UPI0012E18621|nr:flippase [Oceanobacillus salinisoli]